MCPVEEMGRNSVRPSRMAVRMASRVVNVQDLKAKIERKWEGQAESTK